MGAAMLTAATFRKIALSMAGAVEGAHMDHPDFRMNGRIFASLHPGDRIAMVKLTPAEQRELVRERPEAFAPSAGAWGRQGCTEVRLEAADETTVRAAMVAAAAGASATRGRSAARRGPRRGTQRRPRAR